VTPAGPFVVAARTSLLLVLAVTFQFSVAARFELFGVQGDVMLLIAVMAGLTTGSDRGAAVAFAAGIAFDLLLQSPFGLSALTYVIVAYAIGALQDTVLRAAWWIPVVTAVIGSAFGVILYGVFGTMVGEDLLHPSLLKVAAVVALLNAVLAPVVHRLVRWATDTTDTVRARAIMR
jgi:rod shape-determining protein MreD